VRLRTPLRAVRRVRGRVWAAWGSCAATPTRSRVVAGGVHDRFRERASDTIPYALIYWHFGALAIHGFGGKRWERWVGEFRKALLSYQRLDGCESGSWPPAGAWGSQGGRVYASALNTLTLLTPWRYPSWDR